MKQTYKSQCAAAACPGPCFKLQASGSGSLRFQVEYVLELQYAVRTMSRGGVITGMGPSQERRGAACVPSAIGTTADRVYHRRIL